MKFPSVTPAGWMIEHRSTNLPRDKDQLQADLFDT